jgi:chaperonin GroES
VTHEIPPTARPRCHRVYRCRGEDAGGIIIPDTAREKLQQGRVIAVGPGGRDENGKLIPIDVRIGDRILFSK